jgi:hypothetical protein
MMCTGFLLSIGELNKAGFAKTLESDRTGADGVGAADDNVIENFDRQNATGFDKLLCDAHVLGAWGRVSAWVVVGYNDGGGVVDDGAPEDFAGVDKGTVKDAKGHKALVYDVVFRVQVYDEKGFLSGKADVFAKGGNVGGCAGADRGAVRVTHGLADKRHVHTERPFLRRLCSAAAGRDLLSGGYLSLHKGKENGCGIAVHVPDLLLLLFLLH